MDFKFFSRNGELLPIERASVPLSNIAYQYGFGVYESIRVSSGVAFFVAEHIERLMESARIIGLQHPFMPLAVEQAILELIEKNAVETCNVKIVLIGAKSAEDAQLNIMCLNPFFPDDRLYRDGVHCITYAYERAFPHAKALNMQQSYIAYSKARVADAYDALLVDSEGNITEGTRTNFFCMKGKTLYSPPDEKILLGVTRKHVIEVATANGFSIESTSVRPEDLGEYDGAFLTSTSSKILPIRSVDELSLGEIPEKLRDLMTAFNSFLQTDAMAMA